MNIARYIDHTALSADTTIAKINQLCQEAISHHFWSVCINPAYISLAKSLLKDTDVKVCTVIGFPLGANMPEVKAYETKLAIDAGTDEVDMVVNIGWVKSGLWEEVKQDISLVFQACDQTPLKVIFETCLLTDDEIIKLSKICSEIGVAFVKTSTGFSHNGATIEAVTIMQQHVSENVKIKASGGVRSKETAEQMIKAGASRLGTSSGVAIVTGMATPNSQY
ncbi:deoxyribose-phosphate aldolase [Canicola haemoglobinophilus]|uniref:Deoxyribose-phosphate aldolase n=1 Tax=Canicola haemoglobinophilus TaxID=733 RepID=A0A1V4B186_9PAST|nr:deoxyribose-phosphate aldolase [Canicola haemoglobinophilus]OOS00666.1 deoxyribose-phosphate aldolase [Canicola haemoglobinophilus]STO54342.1 2-deoxyribose-5-phosphate aldolase [Canicola haemoglobinophilus]STO60188.1 2-deoxyribose-5-phosphate aldolase [Canicola haemoglobinophilus]STO68876.1 2-deoxyribose-5-phosphate aldolase [Canicola haemoglobinophilus]